MKLAGICAAERFQPPGSEAARGVTLAHFVSPAACVRQVLAAHAVRHCPHVMEIGGAGLPITDFLTHHPQTVTVIDPKIQAFAAAQLNGAPCAVRHIAAKIQEVALEPAAPYALVLLGLSLKPFGRTGATPSALLTLASRAEALVIDYALDLPRAQAQIGTLVATRSSQPLIDLVLTINDTKLRDAGFDRRRFLLFRAG